MAAALACASFAPVAPAALYYYGPKPQTLLKRISEVFEVLGLGAPAPMTLDACAHRLPEGRRSSIPLKRMELLGAGDQYPDFDE
jgi:hypothetical protein